MRRATITREKSGVILSTWDGLALHHAWGITGPLALNLALSDAARWVRPRDRCRLTMEARADARAERLYATPLAFTLGGTLTPESHRLLLRTGRALMVWRARHDRVTAMLAEMVSQPTSIDPASIDDLRASKTILQRYIQEWIDGSTETGGTP